MLAVSLLAIYVLCFGKIYVSKHQLNYADEQRCRMIGEAITEYEEQSGNKVTQIAFYKDGAYMYSQYQGVFCWGDLCVSAFVKGWSDIQVVNYYLNSQYGKAEMDASYADYFAGQNWNQFSNEQMIFDGNTLHYCVY